MTAYVATRNFTHQRAPHLRGWDVTKGDIFDVPDDELAEWSTEIGDGSIAAASLYRPGGTDVAVADGGTGASTAAGARANLGAVSPATVGAAITFHDDFQTVGALNGMATPWGTRAWVARTASNTADTDVEVDSIGVVSKDTAGSTYFYQVDVSPPETVSCDFSFDAGVGIMSAVVFGTSPKTGTDVVGANGIATNSVHAVFGPTQWTISIYDGSTLTLYGSGTYAAELVAGQRYHAAVRRVSELWVAVYPPVGAPVLVKMPGLPLYWGKTAWWELYQPSGTFATDRRGHIHATAVSGSTPDLPDVVSLNSEQWGADAGAPSRSWVGSMPAWGLRDAQTDGIGCVVRVPRHWNTFDIVVVFSPQATAANAVRSRIDYAWADMTSTAPTLTVGTARTTTIPGVASTTVEQTMESSVAIDVTGKRLFMRLLRLGTDGADTHTDTVFVPEVRLVRAS